MPNRGPFRRTPLGRLLHGGFKTLELNAAGWSALIGTGIAAGALLFLISNIPLAPALLAGMLGTWTLLLALDHYRWRNLPASISRGELGPDDYRAAVARLKVMGIRADYGEVVDDETGEIQTAVECRGADAEVVTALLDELAAARHS